MKLLDTSQLMKHRGWTLILIGSQKLEILLLEQDITASIEMEVKLSLTFGENSIRDVNME